MAPHEGWRPFRRRVEVRRPTPAAGAHETRGDAAPVSDCVFCGIARGTIPARVIYQDELVVAFDDIHPQAPVHALIIPRSHHEHLGDSVSAELMAALFSAVPLVAAVKGVDESGYRVIVNAGRDAKQTVQHLHVHVLGGRMMSHGMVLFTPGDDDV